MIASPSPFRHTREERVAEHKRNAAIARARATTEATGAATIGRRRGRSAIGTPPPARVPNGTPPPARVPLVDPRGEIRPRPGPRRRSPRRRRVRDRASPRAVGEAREDAVRARVSRVSAPTARATRRSRPWDTPPREKDSADAGAIAKTRMRTIRTATIRSTRTIRTMRKMKGPCAKRKGPCAIAPASGHRRSSPDGRETRAAVSRSDPSRARRRSSAPTDSRRRT